MDDRRRDQCRTGRGDPRSTPLFAREGREGGGSIFDPPPSKIADYAGSRQTSRRRLAIRHLTASIRCREIPPHLAGSSLYIACGILEKLGLFDGSRQSSAEPSNVVVGVTPSPMMSSRAMSRSSSRTLGTMRCHRDEARRTPPFRGGLLMCWCRGLSPTLLRYPPSAAAHRRNVDSVRFRSIRCPHRPEGGGSSDGLAVRHGFFGASAPPSHHRPAARSPFNQRAAPNVG